MPSLSRGSTRWVLPTIEVWLANTARRLLLSKGSQVLMRSAPGMMRAVVLTGTVFELLCCAETAVKSNSKAKIYSDDFMLWQVCIESSKMLKKYYFAAG